MEKIIYAFEIFMQKHGQYYHQFYVGVAKDPNDRLINGHRVNANTPHIYWNMALNTEVVRAIEKHFIEKGCMGGPGGGDDDTCYIYLYKVLSHTRQ